MKQENNKIEAKQLTIDLGLKPQLEPIIQWVGGKRRLQLEINQYLPDNINDYTYVEPFIGGGGNLVKSGTETGDCGRCQCGIG